MATLTTIVIGRVGDAIDSDADSQADETFTSIFDNQVKLEHRNLVSASTVVQSLDKMTTYTEGAGDDYTVDSLGGHITVLSTGTMADATSYYISYDYNLGNLAFKINEVTSPAQAGGKDFFVKTANMGGVGVAVIVTEV